MMELLLDFNDLKQGEKALKKLRSAFTRAGNPVATADVDQRVKRTNGFNYRQVAITFTDNQTLLLSVNQTGDIWQVKLNGTVTPIKNQTDQTKAVSEISGLLDAGRVKFQAKLARQRVTLPKTITTAAPKLEEKLQTTLTDVNTRVESAQAKVNELKGKLGIALDSVGKATNNKSGENNVLDSVATLESLKSGDFKGDLDATEKALQEQLENAEKGSNDEKEIKEALDCIKELRENGAR